jgi:hypothetical protein
MPLPYSSLISQCKTVDKKEDKSTDISTHPKRVGYLEGEMEGIYWVAEGVEEDLPNRTDHL